MKRVFLFLVAMLFFLPNLLKAEMVIKVTDFEKGFSDWKVKEFKGKANFSVVTHPKKSIILESKNSSFSLAKELKFDLSKYPFLNFDWQVITLPERGDVRDKDLDDQAAQIYVIIPSFPEMVNFKAIGYIWDSNAPPGYYDSKKNRNIKYVVLKSGPKGLGEWFHEKVNVHEDFKRLWQMDIQGRKIVVSISIDSDDTKSSAKSAFGEIYFSER